MKKIILGFLLVLFSLNLSAQSSERHEISVFYGRLSNTDIYGYGLEQLANLIAGVAKGNKVRVVSSGTIGLSYFYRLSNMVSLGIMGMYDHFYDANMVENRIYYRYGGDLPQQFDRERFPRRRAGEPARHGVRQTLLRLP